MFPCTLLEFVPLSVIAIPWCMLPEITLRPPALVPLPIVLFCAPPKISTPAVWRSEWPAVASSVRVR